ncbi:MAG TPA: DNA-processing protein DprA [Vicinamibacterales bacterium]|nr:DNA-processing protein DprA [Vicinamibacterales bacterium]
MDLLNAVALSLIHGISRPRAAAVFKELRAQTSRAVALEEVIAACGADERADSLARRARDEAASLIERARAAGIAPIRSDDDAYPPMLRAIADPPPVLWARGALDALNRPAVAIVGSRAATPYATEVAARLAAELAGRQVVVVSGLARGVDGAAHRGSVQAGGRTIAVMGSGPDVIYPREHDGLAASICRDGALVSELGPGAPPLPEHFPLRNRLISGISLGVVVVEASEKSGSLITARCALDQGRDVMAVPGSVLGGRNRGSHALLKDGAKVVETADDILEELGWPALGEAPKISGNPLIQDELLSKLTPGEAYDLDELSATVEMDASKLLPRLTEWELEGRLIKVSGGRYTLAH